MIVPTLPGQRFRDAVGPADDLEHRRLHVDLGREVLAEARVQEVVERERFADNACRGAKAWRRAVATPCRSGVAILWRQSAFEAEPFDHPLAIVLGQWAIQGVRGHCLCEELGCLAPPVGAHLAQAEPLFRGHRRRLVDVGGLVDAAERLDGDAQLTAIVERRGVMMRDARSAGIQVLPLIERRLLRRPGFLAGLPAPDGERPAPEARARFEDVAVVAKLSQLVGRCQSGDAGAQDDDARPSGRASDRRRPRRCRKTGQAHRLHRAMHGNSAPGLSDSFEKGPSRPGHEWLRSTGIDVEGQGVERGVAAPWRRRSRGLGWRR